MFNTIHNKSYWSMSPQDKASLHLPKLFNKVVYNFILEFMGIICPIFNHMFMTPWMMKIMSIASLVSHHMHAPIDLNESKIEDVDYGYENYPHNLWITLFKTIVSTSSTMHVQQNSRMFMNGDINKLHQISTPPTIPCNRVWGESTLQGTPFMCHCILFS